MKKVLEILISTMDRNELSFLEPMFPGRNISEFNILIVNQTNTNTVLESDLPNVRIINSFEYGLSKSRNLALTNAIGEIGLIADDDVVYHPNFDREILNAFAKYRNAAMITFQFSNENNLPRKKYINRERQITSLKNELDISSCEMAIRMDAIQKNKVRFNEFFGLGAKFPSGEETIFLKEMLNQKLPVFHVCKVIGKHPQKSTGSQQENKGYIRGLSALKYLKYGTWSRFSLMRFIFLAVKNHRVPFKKTFGMYRTGSQAIRECRKIFKHRENPF